MKVDVTTRRLGTTFVVVSALTIVLAGLLVARGSRLEPNYKPGPVNFDDSTGLPAASATTATR
jgi:hypothetical protein